MLFFGKKEEKPRYEIMEVVFGNGTKEIMRFEHKGRIYEVDMIIDCFQEDDPDFRILSEDFYALGRRVKKDFVWNGASTPNTPLMKWTVPKFERSLKASCLHDLECELAAKAETKEERDRLRKLADERYAIMCYYIEGMSWYKCKIAYAGVRAGAKFGVGGKKGKTWRDVKEARQAKVRAASAH